MSVELDDVERSERARERRVRRWLTAGLVVACVGGPLVGFAAARAGEDHPDRGVTAGPLAAGSRDTAAAATPAPGDAALEHLFTRTTGDGVAIRAYRSTVNPTALPPPAPCPPGAACPARDCVDTVGTAPILGELSTDAAVTTAFGSATSTPGAGATGIATADWGTFGVAEGAPARWAIASVGAAVTRVRATFPGGGTDEMEPVDGLVLLAGRVDDATRTGGLLEALDRDGTVVDHVDLAPGGGSTASATASGSAGTATGSAESSTQLHTRASSDGSSTSADASSSVSSSVSSSASSSVSPSGGAVECPPRPGPLPGPAPPAPTVRPTLPPPGEQPVDPTTARAEIERAFSVSYDGRRSPDEKAAYQEAPSGLSEEQIAASGYATQMRNASATVTDVVFTSPTTAAVRYGIAVADWPNQFPDRVGDAVLVDGRWKVARSTLCKDLSLAGLACPSK